MEFKGTKGKWKVTKMQNICDENSKIIFANQSNFSIEETIANALLISKAPEMLEMLKIILEGKCDITEWKKEMAKQLIKEATEL